MAGATPSLYGRCDTFLIWQVQFEDCFVQNGDDGVAIKSGMDWAGQQVGIPSANITVGATIADRTLSPPALTLSPPALD